VGTTEAKRTSKAREERKWREQALRFTKMGIRRF